MCITTRSSHFNATPRRIGWRRKGEREWKNSNFLPEVYCANGDSKLRRVIKIYWKVRQFRFGLNVIARRAYSREYHGIHVPPKYFNIYSRICQSISGVSGVSPDAISSLCRNNGTNAFPNFIVVFLIAIAATTITIRTCIKFVHCPLSLGEKCHFLFTTHTHNIHCCGVTVLRVQCVVLIDAISSWATFYINIHLVHPPLSPAQHTHTNRFEHRHLDFRSWPIPIPLLIAIVWSTVRQAIDSRIESTVQL